VTRFPPAVDPAGEPPAVLHLPGPADPSPTPVVAVPGLGLSVDVPARTLRRLQQVVGSAVVALPGYGLPSQLGVAKDPAALAGRLLEQLDTAQVTEAVLLGHSASCQIIVDAAVKDPTRIVGLVLVGPTTDPRATRWPALAARWLRTAAWEHPGQIPILMRDYHQTGLIAMARAMDAARRQRIDRLLATVTCPVLVVRGRHDRIAPADWVSTLAELAPQGRAVTLPAGAHMIPITHPTALAAQIEAFHSAVVPPSQPAPA
jgi:pimeloyl-ACP methyl ester carboxylesterase